MRRVIVERDLFLVVHIAPVKGRGLVTVTAAREGPEKPWEAPEVRFYSGGGDGLNPKAAMAFSKAIARASRLAAKGAKEFAKWCERQQRR